MPETTIEALFSGPWGIVDHRRKEIENGPYGIYGRLRKWEIEDKFLTAEQSADILDCGEGTARKRLAEHEARYIKEGSRKLYLREDVERLKPKQEPSE